MVMTGWGTRLRHVVVIVGMKTMDAPESQVNEVVVHVNVHSSTHA